MQPSGIQNKATYYLSHCALFTEPLAGAIYLENCNGNQTIWTNHKITLYASPESIPFKQQKTGKCFPSIIYIYVLIYYWVHTPSPPSNNHESKPFIGMNLWGHDAYWAVLSSVAIY